MQILEANVYQENRDAQCASDVANMAEMGKFEVDFPVYGCAYLENDCITYRVSSDAKDIYCFLDQSAHYGLYPTSIKHYIRQTPVPSGLRDQIAYETKITLAHMLKHDYGHTFFNLLEPFTKTLESDASASALFKMAEFIEGRFNEWELQLLEGTLNIAFEAKQLTEQSFQSLQTFIKKTRQQMEEDPIVQNIFSRTLFGFCYLTNRNTIKIYVDAQELPVLDRQKRCQSKGYITAPVIEQTYWFKDFGDLPGIRQQFIDSLRMLQNEAYFDVLKRIKTLPAAFVIKDFQEAYQELKHSHSTQQEMDDFRSYGYRWNVFNIE